MHWIDPKSLPTVQGSVEQFIINPEGDLDGLVMARGEEMLLVHFPPHMAGDVEHSIKVGEQIVVHGVWPRGVALIAAVALTNADGRQLVDRGPGGAHAKREKTAKRHTHRDHAVSGRVRLSLFGPKGELRGALLEDNTAIRVGKKEAEEFAELLRPGAALAVRGEAVITTHCSAIDAKAMGPTLDTLRPVAPKKHGKEKDRDNHQPEIKKPKHSKA